MPNYTPDTRKALQRAMRHAMISDETKLAQEIEYIFREHQDQRRPYEKQWEEIAQLVVPKYEFFVDEWFNESEYDGPKGADKKIGEKIYDHTAAISLKTLADGLMGYLVSRQSRWFHLVFEHPDTMELPGVRKWVQDIEDILFHVLSRSNFYDELHAAITIAGSFGTVCQFKEYDEERNVPVFSTRNPVEMYVAANHRGDIDTYYRLFRLTKRQAEQMWDPAMLSERIRDTSDPTKRWPFLHAVFPRTDLSVQMGLHDRRMGSVLSCDAPWASVYKEVSGSGIGGSYGSGQGLTVEKVLSVGGYWECPYTAWRWETETQSVYGSSPTRDLLPLIRKLQKWGSLLDLNAEMNTTPPANIPATMGDQYQMFPRGINRYTDPQAMAEFMKTMGAYPIGKDREDDARFMVKEAYGTDTFLMLRQLSREGDGGDRTAYETAELVSERAAILGSAMGRMESDALVPSVLYVYRQEVARARMPEPPPALEKLGRPAMTLDMIGLLAIAQKLLKYRSAMQGLQMAMPLAELMPQPPESVDAEGLFKDMVAAAGVPANRIRTEEQMADIRKQRAELAAQQQQAESLETAGKVIRDAGGAQEALGAAASLGAAPGVAEAVATNQ